MLRNPYLIECTTGLLNYQSYYINSNYMSYDRLKHADTTG